MNNKKIYIFIPGYYGSTLKDENTGRLIWGDTKEVLFGRKTLAMHIPGMLLPGILHLKPHELIPDKKILGGLLKEDAYDKTIALLKSADAEDVISVAWDWRREPMHGVRCLDRAVKSAKIKYPNHQFVLVSHSFGSLVASYYLRYGNHDYFEAKENWEGLEHFTKIILSACPYRGLMAIFRNMHYGIKFGLNHKMQNPLAFCTFESSYYLLPPPGLDLIRDQQGNSFSLNLHDPKSWSQNNWGLFHEKLKLPHESIEARMNFISLHLNRAVKFHQLIDASIVGLPNNKKEILYLSGFGLKTVHQGVWLKNIEKKNVFLYYPKNFKKWKSSILPETVFGDGDATIPDFSLKIPSSLVALNTKIINEKIGHLDILQSPKSQKNIYDFLMS